MRPEMSCHYFDVERSESDGRAENSAMLDLWAGECKKVKEEYDAIEQNFLKKGYDFKFARLGIRKAIRQDGLAAMTMALQSASTDIDAASIMFSSPSKFYNQFVCGAQKLCNELGIEPSVVTYRSIMAAVYQLATYADLENGGFGTEVIILMIRSKEVFGHTVGFTLITRILLRELKDGLISRCAAKLLEIFETPGWTQTEYLDKALKYYTFRRLIPRFKSVVSDDAMPSVPL
jgi:hypothetical protein